MAPQLLARQSAGSASANFLGRRTVFVLFGAGTLLARDLVATPAHARDVNKALKEKQARKDALRAAAEEAKQTGADRTPFKTPDYSLSEEAHTPNIHTRQGEALRKQRNV